MAKGKKTGGRRKGSVPIDRKTVQETMDALKCDPFEAMARIGLNDVICTECRGVKRTRFILPEAQERACRKCLQSDQRMGTPEELAEFADPDCEWCCGTGWQTVSERPCASCNTTGMEPITPELSGKMWSDLAKYLKPQLKAIEHVGSEGGPIQHEHRIIFEE